VQTQSQKGLVSKTCPKISNLSGMSSETDEAGAVSIFKIPKYHPWTMPFWLTMPIVGLYVEDSLC